MGIAAIDPSSCLSWQGLRCEVCFRICPVKGKAITLDPHPRQLSKHAVFVPVIHPDDCTGCGLCTWSCPTERPAINIVERKAFLGRIGEHYRLGWLDSEDQPHHPHAPKPAPAAPATPAAGSGNTATRITSISTPAPAAAGNLDEDVAEDPAESSTPTAARRSESNITASSGTPGRYLVKSGDTLSSIAREHGLRLDTLRRANPSLRGNTLIAGSYLVIPDKNGRVADAQADSNSGSSEKTYTIKSGDTLGAVARKHGVSLQKLLDANNISKKDANRIKIGQKIIIPE